MSDFATAHILIVDDDVALLRALPEALRLRMPEAHVDTADSAFAALERIQVTDYDAIVSDVKMPGMDGLTLLARIRDCQPDTPTLLITGHGEHDLAVQALRGGAYDFIQKPIERDYFIASLRRAIQTRQLRRQVEDQQRSLARHAMQLEATVAERTRELQAALSAREEFISIAAHELKTPLTSLKALTQMTRRRLERANSQEAAAAVLMERSLRRMELLVNDLLDISRIEAGRLRVRLEPHDVVTICRQVIDEQGSGASHPIELRAPGHPIYAMIDAERLSQALLNLLSNAAKYSPPEEPIEVGVEEGNGSARMWVRDHGAGIPAAALPHLFERFYQAPDSEAQTGSSVGLGLGLYITREIIERLNGRLDAESVVGQGSVFRITLPLAQQPVTVSEISGQRTGKRGAEQD